MDVCLLMREKRLFSKIGVYDSRCHDSGMWDHVNQIQYPEIKKICGDTAAVLYCRSNKRLQIENESVP